MASSLATILVALPQTPQCRSTFRSDPPKLSLTLKPKATVTCKATLSTTLETSIQQQQQQDDQKQKPVAEVWRKIHGEDNWAGLLDPMDPVMRGELTRYGEMAQACYDAFDFDPYSKYCGSCRFPLPEFFDSLGMTNVGYTMTRYLYATANINLPNFFKHSRWSKMWSKHANWAGYVAVSDDATTKLLGRRDITIAFRGTVTRLEWVADLMDFLKPISSNGIPCPDHTVKVESGFLDLYTDKEESCGYAKYSAREQVHCEKDILLKHYFEHLFNKFYNLFNDFFIGFYNLTSLII